ncbi:hypothetical protein EVAR_25588_1 [Eumeta japonica]|uniref:Uncharacterized protein n=1 Tax=Eumeta variegata TaxID=151549 RepID=A0A4C1V2L4_EUMVA|nr:hypothetical protein EVAR_25588_1 [Eumeta japonica]
MPRHLAPRLCLGTAVVWARLLGRAFVCYRISTAFENARSCWCSFALDCRALWCCARGRPIIVEWERRKHSAGLSRSVTHRNVTERYTFHKMPLHEQTRSASLRRARRVTKINQGRESLWQFVRRVECVSRALVGHSRIATGASRSYRGGARRLRRCALDFPTLLIILITVIRNSRSVFRPRSLAYRTAFRRCLTARNVVMDSLRLKANTNDGSAVMSGVEKWLPTYHSLEKRQVGDRPKCIPPYHFSMRKILKGTPVVYQCCEALARVAQKDCNKVAIARRLCNRRKRNDRVIRVCGIVQRGRGFNGTNAIRVNLFLTLLLIVRMRGDSIRTVLTATMLGVVLGERLFFDKHSQVIGKTAHRASTKGLGCRLYRENEYLSLLTLYHGSNLRSLRTQWVADTDVHFWIS